MAFRKVFTWPVTEYIDINKLKDREEEEKEMYENEEEDEYENKRKKQKMKKKMIEKKKNTCDVIDLKWKIF